MKQTANNIDAREETAQQCARVIWEVAQKSPRAAVAWPMDVIERAADRLLNRARIKS